MNEQAGWDAVTTTTTTTPKKKKNLGGRVTEQISDSTDTSIVVIALQYPA